MREWRGLAKKYGWSMLKYATNAMRAYDANVQRGKYATKRQQSLTAEERKARSAAAAEARWGKKKT